MMDQLIPVVYMIGVLLLVLPAFLQSNSKLKQLLTNFTIWIIIVLIILTFIYLRINEETFRDSGSWIVVEWKL
jgi:VIT1/CCC1 family predicted Fe2+/Mn2+ transporter